MLGNLGHRSDLRLGRLGQRSDQQMLRSVTQHLGHRKENSFTNEFCVGFAVAGFAVVGLAVVKLGSPSGGARHVLWCSTLTGP